MPRWRWKPRHPSEGNAEAGQRDSGHLAVSRKQCDGQSGKTGARSAHAMGNEAISKSGKLRRMCTSTVTSPKLEGIWRNAKACNRV